MINPLEESYQKLIEVLDRLFENFRVASDHKLQSEGWEIVAAFPHQRTLEGDLAGTCNFSRGASRGNGLRDALDPRQR